jgi:hypothetical protein
MRGVSVGAVQAPASRSLNEEDRQQQDEAWLTLSG